MSMDYPVYEEMKRRNCRRGMRLWMAGDRLYYLGLLTAVMGTLAYPIFRFGQGDGFLRTSLAMGGIFLFGTVVFFGGARLKKASHEEARKAGIDPDRCV